MIILFIEMRFRSVMFFREWVHQRGNEAGE